MSIRFTIDGSEDLEARLGVLCAQIAEEVRRIVPAGRLEGLLLGGGYGRGEGGVLRTTGKGRSIAGQDDTSGVDTLTCAEDRPYNDLEFYVLIRGPVFLNDRRYRRALHELGERLSPEAGLEVEFKILSLHRLERSPVSMFYYDLVVGHRRLIGADNLLDRCAHHRDATKIPLHEATRLLMNRCSGLLFSLERLRRTNFAADDADFVGRNLAKAQLAFGDVVLAAHGLYDQSCRKRLERLRGMAGDASMPWLDMVRRHHAEGVEFKLHPVCCAEAQAGLEARHAELTSLGRAIWLWLEGRRLHVRFATTREYALSPVDKCPETSPWRNRLVHLKTGGVAAALSREARRYPRHGLLHDLALLLWEPRALQAADFSGRVAAYAENWHRFN